MSELQGRVVVVTGAGGNVGAALCRRLLAEGASVVGLDHQASLDRLGALPGAFEPRAAELNDESAVESAFDLAASFGPLWGVVHTAGGWQGGAHVSDTPLQTLDDMWNTNLRSAFVVSRAAMRRLVPAQGGRIVLIGSLTAAHSIRLAGSGAYNVAKAGVIALTQVLAAEGKASGVQANCIAPGTIDTPANRAGMPQADHSRWASLEQVVDAIAGALSPRSGLDGAVLTVPGRE